MATARDVKDEVRSRVNIVDVVGNYVQLKQSGSRLVGLCPFHDEDTPSFSVNAEKGLYHCFGCKAGGDVFTFLMEMEGLSFREALVRLAKDVGVAVPGASGSGEVDREEHADLFAATRLAQRLYTQAVKGRGGQRARNYLRYRGINQDTASRFRLGYAPDGWHTVTNALAKEKKTDAGVGAGLLVKKDNGRVFDLFRDRIIFPILNDRGDPVGFGGRLLGEGRPKYLNSPETPLFVKRKQLYGFFQAKESIRRSRRVVLVEGFMDCIALHQAGVDYTVATCGTALTHDHVKQVLRLAEELYICYDGDAAGKAGIQKGLQVLEQVSATVRVVPLPEGADPDSFVRDEGKAGFLGLLERAVPLKDFLLEEAVKGTDLNSTEGRLQAARAIVPLLKRMQSRVERDIYTQRMAARLNIPVASLAAEVGNEEPRREASRHTNRENRNTSRDFVRKPKRRKKTNPRELAERELLRCLIEDPTGVKVVTASLGEAPFALSTYNVVFRGLGRGLEGPEALLVLDESEAKVREELLQQGRGELTWRHCLQKVQLLHMREELSAMEEGFARLVDNDPVQYLKQINHSLLAFKRWRKLVQERLAMGTEA